MLRFPQEMTYLIHGHSRREFGNCTRGYGWASRKINTGGNQQPTDR